MVQPNILHPKILWDGLIKILLVFKPSISYVFATPLDTKPLNYDEIYRFDTPFRSNYVPYYAPGLCGVLKENHKHIMLRWLENTKLILRTKSSLFDYIFISGQYDINEMLFLKKVLKKGDVFVDAGANIGIYSIYASKIICETGKVYAFEPSNREFNILLKNIKINRCNNILPFKVALSDKKGRASIIVEKQGGGNTLCDKLCDDNFEYDYEEDCVVDTLDNLLLNKVSKIDCIKVDVEGYDFKVLLGGQEILKKFNPHLLLEISKKSLENAGISEKNIISFVKDLGYNVYYFSKGTTLTQRPPKYVETSPFYNIVCINPNKDAFIF